MIRINRYKERTYKSILRILFDISYFCVTFVFYCIHIFLSIHC